MQKTTDWRITKLQKLVEEGLATDEEKSRLALMLEASGLIEPSTSLQVKFLFLTIIKNLEWKQCYKCVSK